MNFVTAGASIITDILVPSIAMVSDTSNRLDHDTGISGGLHTARILRYEYVNPLATNFLKLV